MSAALATPGPGSLVTLRARRPLPAWPCAWYPIARSAALRRGASTSGEIAGRPYVAYRGASGRLAALDAHCPHMGAHLRHARVVGEDLLCPLHHWTVTGEGRCRGRGAGPLHRARPWPIAERFGLVFVYAGGDPPPPLPAPEDAEGYAWTTGRPIELDTSWHAMMVNGFDLAHLRAVHHRALVAPPELTRDGRTLRLRYTSRVTRGGGLSDALMRWIARDRIRVQQTCHGPTIVVESDLGRARTAAVLGLVERGGKVRAYGAFGARRGPLVRVKLLLARWLFTAFLRKDFAVVEGMRLDVDGAEDEGVRAIAAYLRSLPEVARGG